MSNSETAEIKARTTIGVGLIGIGIVVTLFVLWAAEPIRKVVPVCISTFSQLCSYVGGTMIIVYMAVFGLVMPITGILLIERDYESVSRRK